MRSRRHVEELGETGIDLAPMLDFVLNLLIFFIITTSFVREAGIVVDRPTAATAEHKESGNILIAIAANGDIWMDRRQVDLREVRPTIERLHVERPDDTVVVVADKSARAGLVGQVMDEVQIGGIREVAIAASSESEGSGS
jgi:biopolymer transport protein ExbD